jgi:hypothetical protein
MKAVCAFASVLVATGLMTANANAGSITVLNPSFEIAPAGGYPLTGGCDGVLGCMYSEAPIPDWVNAQISGQWQPGSTPNPFFFNSLPDGPTVGYTNGPNISQTVSATAVAGDTYTLTVDVGYRQDLISLPYVELVVGSNSALATPATTPVEQSGDWYLYTAVYKATAADAGQPITIILGLTPGIFNGQADFDAVALSGSVPEPATWAMLILGGFGLAAAARLHRVRRGAAAG